jgi:hypothetical protein
MHADDHEPFIRILLVPLRHVRLEISAVIAAEGTELDHHDFALQVGHAKGHTAEPDFVDDVRRWFAGHAINRIKGCQSCQYNS